MLLSDLFGSKNIQDLRSIQVLQFLAASIVFRSSKNLKMYYTGWHWKKCLGVAKFDITVIKYLFIYENIQYLRSVQVLQLLVASTVLDGPIITEYTIQASSGKSVFNWPN
jgi:hypothetical protein